MVRHTQDDESSTFGEIVLTIDGVKRGARRLLPIAVFTIPFGIAFGVAAIDSGLSSSQAIFMSLVVFSGMAQFTTLDFWHEPVAFASLTLVLLALSARHVVTGAALSPWLNRLRPRPRIISLSFLSDPNFVDSQTAFSAGERDAGVFLGGGLALWVCWVAGTAFGALGGKVLGNPSSFGIDVVMPCFFIATLAGKAGKTTSLLPIAFTGVVSVVLLDLVPTGWNIIVAALCGGCLGSLLDAE